MSNITVSPDSTIRLLKCPLKLDNNNQITWASVNAQTTYFQSLPYIENNNLTYIRKDGVIRVDTSGELDYEDLLPYNYVMYQNTHYDSKWFYAYITDIKYLNDGCTEISIETDVFQTWFFEGDWKASFIEREHVNDDTIGLHTVPENLETGEYICGGKVNLYDSGNTTYIAIATTWVPSEFNLNQHTTQYGGIYSGCVVILFDSPLGASKFIDIMDAKAKKDAIVSIFICPQAFLGTSTFHTVTVDDKTTYCATPEYTSSYNTLATNVAVTRPTTIDGYTPKNKKLLVSPYQYFYVSNNAGIDATYKYEEFVDGSSCKFDTIGTLTPGCSIRTIPLNYKKLSDSSSHYSYNYGVTAPKYPICSWSSDIYTNWLTENGINIALGYGASAFSIIGGIGLIATGAGAVSGAGLIAGGIAGVANQMKQTYEHSLTPPQARGNTSSGDICYSSGSMTIPAFKMSIKQEYAKIIDDYFSAYGYKVNRYGIPHLHVRTYWDYCKTINCNFTGNIPNNDLKKFRELFDNGCTFWHNTSYFMDYSQNNTIIT